MDYEFTYDSDVLTRDGLCRRLTISYEITFNGEEPKILEYSLFDETDQEIQLTKEIREEVLDAINRDIDHNYSKMLAAWDDADRDEGE